MMLLRKLFTIFIPFTLIHGPVHGQVDTRNNAWTRLTIQTKLNQNFQLDNELQHRRQNNFDNQNYFSKDLLNSFRTWVHYKAGQRLQYSLSPFALFKHSPQYRQPTDALKEAEFEARFAAALTFQQPLLGPLTFFSKSGLEYRAFINEANKLRARERLGLSYAKHNWQLSIYEELLLHVAGVPIANFFDQNRLSASVTMRASDRLGLELGYIHTDKLTGTGSLLIDEENLFLNVSYKIGKQ